MKLGKSITGVEEIEITSSLQFVEFSCHVPLEHCFIDGQYEQKLQACKRAKDLRQHTHILLMCSLATCRAMLLSSKVAEDLR